MMTKSTNESAAELFRTAARMQREHREITFEQGWRLIDAICEHGDFFAAASDLLTACKALMDLKTCSPLAMTPDERRAMWAAHELARAAIAKAEG